MDKVLKKAAEILVDCGYATLPEKKYESPYVKVGAFTHFVDPFSDALEGRRQADAIEDWLSTMPNAWKLFETSAYKIERNTNNNHQWRLDRIKFCLEQLEEE